MIAHLDADSFFASVLQRKHPHLKGKPLIALGMGGSCVIAATYEAKAKGVKTGMPMREAIKLCPEAIRMPSDFRETGIASQQIESILNDICPVIEQYSIDEWFLDLASMVGGSPRDPMAWAREVQTDVKCRTDIGVSIGVGPSKLLAKMASEYRKPSGVTVILPPPLTPPPRGEGKRIVSLPLSGEGMGVEAFLRDRPAAAVPGIGRARQVHAQALHWETAWDFAIYDREVVKKIFGSPGPELQRELLGERIAEIISEAAPPKSVSRTRTFRATNQKEYLWAHVLHHTQYVVLKMRKHGLACHGVSVWLRNRDYKHFGESKRLPQAMDTEETVVPYLRSCFEDTYDDRIWYNQAGMSLWGLTPTGPLQASLFEPLEQRIEDQRLQTSLDSLRKKYGREVIARGSAMAAREDVRPGMPLPSF
jgi:DNA polymerase IV